MSYTGTYDNDNNTTVCGDQPPSWATCAQPHVWQDHPVGTCPEDRHRPVRDVAPNPRQDRLQPLRTCHHSADARHNRRRTAIGRAPFRLQGRCFIRLHRTQNTPHQPQRKQRPQEPPIDRLPVCPNHTSLISPTTGPWPHAKHPHRLTQPNYHATR